MVIRTGPTPSLYDRLMFQAEKHCQKPAIQSNAGTMSYRQLLELVDRLAAALASKLSPSDHGTVALCYGNSPESVAFLFAIARLGWTAVLLNTALRNHQLVRQLKHLGVDALVTGASGRDRFDKAIEVRYIWTFEELLDHSDATIAVDPSPDIYSDFIVTMSSGSTSAPKPIALSQQCKWLRSRQAAESYAVTEADVVLCASPIHHSLGQRLSFLPLLHGGTLVLLEHFSVGAWLRAVECHMVSFVIAVASHLQALGEALQASEASISSLRCLVTSSAQIDGRLKRKLTGELGCEFHEMYGASEVATVTDLNTCSELGKLASVGKVLTGIEVKILDEQRKPLESGALGEIAVKSPLRFNGYFRVPELTAEAFAENYFLTGDLGYFDEDGYLHFRGRSKDIIISGGINIVPADIESVLIEHDAIRFCAVIGVPDQFLGEAVLAVVALKGLSSTRDKTSLRLYANEHLAGFQQPKYYAFVDELPLTGSGKLDKSQLRTQYSSIESLRALC